MKLQAMNNLFNQEQAELLNRLLPTLTEAQQLWLSGYFAALHSSVQMATSGATLQAAPTINATPSRGATPEVTILFGSQTGNAQGLAKELSEKFEKQGFQVALVSMIDFKPNTMKKLRNLLILVSTHGEGEPPDNALPFYEFLHSRKAPRLEDLSFSVLALGDSSYEFYCQTGKEFDQRLEELGGKRLCLRADCDLDYDEPAAAWFEEVITVLKMESGSPATDIEVAATADVLIKEQPVYSRTFPFHAEVFENININGRGSLRETRHLELSLEGSNLQYEPGDCLGIYAQNDAALVDALINAMGWNSDELIAVNNKGDKRPLREALQCNYELTVLTKPLLQQAAKLAPSSKLYDLLEAGHEQQLRDYMKERDLLDLVRDFSLFNAPVSEFIPMLRKMPARLYSIASSSKTNPDTVDLTIRAVRYDAHGRSRNGVCSVQCAERVQPGDTLPVYIHPNPNFKLPPDPNAPLIMIGPGTGVAPYRAFLQEREEIFAEGKTWLFYGDQHFLTDFLYQIEWQRWLKEGVLTRMDIAFSRDTETKVYVQHRMLEKSQELFRWLEQGAYVYVCGDEKHMAHDVHTTLIAILEREGGMSSEEAASYLSGMQQQKRYQRDVY